MCGSRGPVGTSNILESALPFDLSIFKSLLQIEVSGCTFQSNTLLLHFSLLIHPFPEHFLSSVPFILLKLEVLFQGMAIFSWLMDVQWWMFYFLLLIWSHIFLFLCFCPQLSECSSQQIQGLSSLRPNLATLSIRHSTETMMVLSDSFDAFHCEFPISCIEKCIVFWPSPVHPGPRGRRAVAVGTWGGGVWLCCCSSHPCVEKPDNAGYESQQHQGHWQICGELHPSDSSFSLPFK